MNTVLSTNARDNLFSLIDSVNSNREPALIAGRRCNAVLVSESDWRAIEETLYLNSIPGMAESISSGLSTPIEECSDTIDWD